LFNNEKDVNDLFNHDEVIIFKNINNQ